MTQRIDIVIKNIRPLQFQRMLSDYFDSDNSPDFPIFISYKYGPLHDGVITEETELFFSDFHIVEAVRDGTEQQIILANIYFSDYGSLINIRIESVGDDSWGAEFAKYVQKIIAKAHQLHFQIVSVEPIELFGIGLYEETSLPGSEMPVPKRPPGRPHHSADIWAWEEVNERGRNISEVKTEWKNRKDVIVRNLVDPDRAFRNALNLKNPKKPT